jgi:hypothetical protein
MPLHLFKQFLGLVSSKSLVKYPAFSWLGKVSQDGIPLLNIKVSFLLLIIHRNASYIHAPTHPGKSF